jgi:PAS domain S-box-containing protein
MDAANPISQPAASTTAWWSATGFVLLASLWLGGGHLLLQHWIDDPELRFRSVLISDGVFVLLCAILLHALLRRLLRRQAQAESGRKARQLLSALADGSSDAIFAKDREGTYLLVNQATARLFQQSPEALVGAGDQQFFSPDQVARIRADDLRVMEAEGNLTIEESMPTAEGMRIFLTTKGPLRNARGETYGLFGIARDITERAAVLAKLESSERRYRLMFDGSPFPISVYDLESLQFLAVNQACIELYGYSRDEFLTMTIMDIRPPEEVQRLEQRIQQGGELKPFDLGSRWTHRCKNGRLMQVEVESNEVTYEGRVARIAMTRDLTAQVAVEREWQQAQLEAVASRDLLRSVLERVEDGFVAFDSQWRYTYANPQAARMLGREGPDDLLGRVIWEEFPDLVGHRFQQRCLQAMKDQAPMDFDGYFEPWKAWFEYRLYPSSEGLTVYFNDITKRKKNEQLLLDREREFRELAEQMPALIYRAALDGSYKSLYVSQHVRLLGFTPEQWLADPTAWVRAVHPDDLARVVAALPTATSAFAEAQIEYRMRDGLGLWRHFRDSSRRVVPEHGETPYLQGVSVDITDLIEAEEEIKRNEARLRASEQRYRLASAHGSVWDWDADKSLLFIGDEFWRQFGYEAETGGDALARFESLVHPDDLERRREMVMNHLRHRAPYDLEFRMRDAQGRWRWLHTQGQAVWDEAGRATYMAGTTVDITERVEARLALQASEDRLRKSELRYRLAASHGRVWDWDLAAERSNFGDELLAQLGYTGPPGASSPAGLEKIMHPDDRALWKRAVREHIRDHRPYDLEFRVKDSQGSWRWLHSQGQAVWNDAGRATYMAGTTVEITERKEAQAALEASEAYRRQLFEQLSDGVLLVGSDHQILDANPQAWALLGLSREALLGASLSDLLAEQELGRIDRLSQASSELAEWAFVRPDGSQFPAEVSTRPLDASRFLAVLRDISQRRQSENALLTYQLELSELTHQLLTQEKQASQRLAQVLHDRLGQTLAVTRLHFDALMTSVQNQMPSVLKSQCETMDRLIGQAVHEVRDVLRELRPPLLEDMGLEAALDNEVNSPSWELAGADLLLEVDDDLGDPHWPANVEYGAFMVAREAITNALRHGQPSLIRVVLGGGVGELRLAVIDDGIGIPDAMVAGRPGHLGVVGMRERAIAIGARFSMARGASGGTTVTLHWKGS